MILNWEFQAKLERTERSSKEPTEVGEFLLKFESFAGVGTFHCSWKVLAEGEKFEWSWKVVTKVGKFIISSSSNVMCDTP